MPIFGRAAPLRVAFCLILTLCPIAKGIDLESVSFDTALSEFNFERTRMVSSGVHDRDTVDRVCLRSLSPRPEDQRQIIPDLAVLLSLTYRRLYGPLTPTSTSHSSRDLLQELLLRASSARDPNIRYAFVKRLRRWKHFSSRQATLASRFAPSVYPHSEGPQAIRRAINEMSVFPISGAMMSLPDSWEWATVSSTVNCAAIALAQRVLALTDFTDTSELRGKNLFADTVAAFEGCGESATDAATSALRLLGLVSTRGPAMVRPLTSRWLTSPHVRTIHDWIPGRLIPLASFAGLYGGEIGTILGLSDRSPAEVALASESLGIFSVPFIPTEKLHPHSFVTTDNFPLVASLAVVANGASFLDSVAFTNRLPYYSLPVEVRSRVSYTKMYHFYLAAYLASRLVAEGFTRETAVQAVYRLSVLYEMGANVSTNQPKWLSLLPSYRFESQKDLAFTYAGARWGASVNMYSGLQIDLDPAFEAWLLGRDRTVYRDLNDYFSMGRFSRFVARSSAASWVSALNELQPEVVQKITVVTHREPVSECTTLIVAP